MQKLSNGIEPRWRPEFGEIFDSVPVLVTGSSGFIGHHLCKALQELGAVVHGITRSSDLGSGVQNWKLDLVDQSETRRVLQQIQPQWVFHLAGQVTADRNIDLIVPMIENNLLATVHLFLASHSVGCRRVVHVGSAESATDQTDVPTSPYAAAKTASSLYMRLFHELYGLPVVEVRPFITYGPGQPRQKLISHVIDCALSGRPLPLTSGQRVCDFIYIRDIVRGILQAARQPDAQGHSFDLGTGRGVSIRNMVEQLVVICESDVQPEFGALPDRQAEAPLVADLEKSRQHFSWEPMTSLNEGLRQTVLWHQRQMGTQ